VGGPFPQRSFPIKTPESQSSVLNNCFHRSVILIVEKVIEPMKKRSGPASRKALVEIVLRENLVPAAQFPHPNSRVAIPCSRQLFSPIGDFNC
jgi:hypothetical protein